MSTNYNINATIQDSNPVSASIETAGTGSGSTSWGSILGTLSNQTDLQAALDLKADQTDLDTLTTTVGTKADQTDLDTLDSTVTALSSTVDGKAEKSQNIDWVGFESQSDGSPASDCTISYNPTTRTITVTPTASEFAYWINGTRYTKTSISQTHADVTGGYFLYIDSNNTVQLSTSAWNILTDVTIAYIYYDSGLADGFALDERHSSKRNPAAHQEMHRMIGTYWVSGLDISNYTVQPASPVDSDNQFQVASGYINDEDLRHAIAGLDGTTYRIFYRDGAQGIWKWQDNNVPVLVDGTYPYYNQFTGGSWQLTPMSNNEYANIYVMHTGSIDSGFQTFIIMDQTVHSTLAAAQVDDIKDIDFGNVPVTEVISSYKVTIRTGASYTTEGKFRIAATASDTRLSTERQIIESSANSHIRLHPMTSTDDHFATANTVFYADTSGDVQELALGTSGQVLTSNGATSAPSFETPAGGGASVWSLVEEKSLLANDTSVTFSGLSGTDPYMLVATIRNNSGGFSNYEIRFNGDSSSDDYFSDYHEWLSSNASGRLTNSGEFADCTSGNEMFIEGLIQQGYNGTDYNACAKTYSGVYVGTDSGVGNKSVIQKNTGVTEITSIEVVSSATNGLGTNSNIRLYKLST